MNPKDENKSQNARVTKGKEPGSGQSLREIKSAHETGIPLADLRLRPESRPKLGSKASLSFAGQTSHCGFEDDDVDIEIPAEETKIVMPLDATDHSFYCLHYYIKHIHRPLNTVYAVYVSDDFVSHTVKDGDGELTKSQKCCKCLRKATVDLGPSPGVLAELRKKDRHNCLRVKHRVKHLFNHNGIKWDFSKLRGTDAGSTILEYTKRINGNLIVMGNRGINAMKRTIYGSVSDKLLHHALVPVLIVKKPQGALTCETLDKETTIH